MTLGGSKLPGIWWSSCLGFWVSLLTPIDSATCSKYPGFSLSRTSWRMSLNFDHRLAAYTLLRGWSKGNPHCPLYIFQGYTNTVSWRWLFSRGSGLLFFLLYTGNASWNKCFVYLLLSTEDTSLYSLQQSRGPTDMRNISIG